MTISKITNPPSQKGVIDKINEVIDSIGGSGGVVTSVNGQTGDVTLTASDVGALPDSTVIPSVNNATLTIQKNGTTVKTFTANASTDVTANITVPTKTSDLTNDSGYTTNVGTVTSVNNTSPDSNGNVTISIPSEVTESTVSGWGFTKNTGTVTSVNNVSPVNGNVTLSIPDTSNLANKDLSNLSSTGNSKFQVPLVSGTNIKTINNNSILGSGDITLQSAPDIDGISITTNTSDELQTVGVIDSNNTTNAIKTWTGTKAQYEAIVTKDANTLYNITDDTDVTLSLLELLFPVGAIYIGTMNACPLQVLGVGTWQLVASDRVLQGVGQNTSIGDTVEAGLPNITGNISSVAYATQANGALIIDSLGTYNQSGSSASLKGATVIKLDASNSNSIYGNSTTVQPPAYIVNIWERVS